MVHQGLYSFRDNPLPSSSQRGARAMASRGESSHRAATIDGMESYKALVSMMNNLMEPEKASGVLRRSRKPTERIQRRQSLEGSRSTDLPLNREKDTKKFFYD
ncbi:hypothetical protein CYMTET_53842 [Cymbomonas tetramitiformis]|uniref:Uncharacterized protein n=1 Tax=Cymbomonas tetramitiformis TaxID=36881 RepID=A0AAE0BG37_9CHLO|nr:hypothetical protein CYMTET_53842 [Cymbomonas tetramitiformis]